MSSSFFLFFPLLCKCGRRSLRSVTSSPRFVSDEAALALTDARCEEEGGTFCMGRLRALQNTFWGTALRFLRFSLLVGVSRIFPMCI